LNRHRRQARARHGLVYTLEGHRLLGPQTAHECDLFTDAPTPVGELLTEGLVLDAVPPDSDPKAEMPSREDVDLNCLFGDERCLALREDDDSGHELELRDRRQEAEQDERLVKGAPQVVGTLP